VQLAGTSVLVSDLAKVATEERSLMEQSRESLSTLATMHVSSTIHPCLFSSIYAYHKSSNADVASKLFCQNRSNSVAYKGRKCRQLKGGPCIPSPRHCNESNPTNQ
jgi:hypothetical protein